MTDRPLGGSSPREVSAPPDRPGGRIRVLIVDDSSPQSSQLIAILGTDPQLQVIGIIRDGAVAVRAVARLRPDVIAMSLELRIVDGLDATRQIMEQYPTPIVLMVAHASHRNEGVVFEATRAGALAVIPKPMSSEPGDQGAQQLLRTVKTVAGVKLVRRWGRRRPSTPGSAPAAPAGAPRPVRPEIVAIGASTGGPQVLHAIFTQLPASFPLPVLVVQHITAGFAAGLVEWLRPQCALPIALAAPGLALTRPGIVVAPTGQHLIVLGRKLAVSDAPPVSGHRPSATVLLQSVAREYSGRAVGILLTGMGDDGAVGLQDIKRAGGLTIAQDRATSVVFGMPAAAIALGVVDHVLPPAAIPGFLVDLVAPTGGRDRIEEPNVLG